MILPSLVLSAEVADGLTLAQPDVALILPSLIQLDGLASGVTVGQPEAGLILPSPVDLSLQPAGLTLAEPVVVLRLDVPAGSAPNGRPLLMRFAKVISETAPARLSSDSFRARQTVLLEWAGPATGQYIVEASTNLTSWTPVAATLLSEENGVHRARCATLAPETTFYRLRHEP